MAEFCFVFKFGFGHEELADQKYFIFLNLAVHHNYSLGLGPSFFFKLPR